ncbi:pyrroline-5-carboxylate reductase [Striga asiatica]|uniref:Pyrroline-5-carboxylate reductase n=1 Tax=Striga asiatica TaxID=4170 RepID=A0A5A7Q5C8_STRAF|nr:pyrroline-5-carboxylate reductase [Striga asiatica]
MEMDTGDPLASLDPLEIPQAMITIPTGALKTWRRNRGTDGRLQREPNLPLIIAKDSIGKRFRGEEEHQATQQLHKTPEQSNSKKLKLNPDQMGAASLEWHHSDQY